MAALGITENAPTRNRHDTKIAKLLCRRMIVPPYQQPNTALSYSAREYLNII